MRLIAQLQDNALATRFGDYLTATGMGNDVEQGSNGFSIWVHDDDHVDRAKRELETYLANPLAPQFQMASDAASRVRADQQKREAKLRKNYVDVRTSWARSGAGGLAPLTMFLIAASCAVSFLTNFGDFRKPITEKLWIDGQLVRLASQEGTDLLNAEPTFLHDVRHGQVWRLVTPMFVHMSVMHLLFNMMWLYQLGGLIERRKGSAWMVLLVLSTAVASDLVQYWWAGPFSGGMSGVVYALFGYAWMKGKFQPQEGIGVPQQTVVLMLVWLFVCMTGLVGPIANAAHVVGLLGGIALGHAQYSWKHVRKNLLHRNDR